MILFSSNLINDKKIKIQPKAATTKDIYNSHIEQNLILCLPMPTFL